jgi:hypothetical protein
MEQNDSSQTPRFRLGFPELSPRHLRLLVFAAVLSACCALVMLRQGYTPYQCLAPFLLLLIVWRKAPLGWRRYFWLISIASFTYILSYMLIGYLWLLLHGLG